MTGVQTCALPISARLAEVAARVSARAEVNHNYEREHRYNLWFVVTGPDARHVAETVAAIERDADCGTALSLPMVEPYHIDLGFDLRRDAAARAARAERRQEIPSLQLDEAGRALVAALQEGLPLEPRPWSEL